MPLPSWGAASPTLQPYNGDPEGAIYAPASCDTVLAEHYWFWVPTEPQHLRSTCALVGVYLTSVGRSSNLILNIAPDVTGGVPAADVEAYAAMGAAVACLWAAPLGEVLGVTLDGESGAAEVAWPAPVPSRAGAFALSLHLQEEMAATGQRIAQFAVDARVDSSGGGGGGGGARNSSSAASLCGGAGQSWVSLLPASLTANETTAVGHKRILRAAPLGGFGAAATISALRFTALSAYRWAGDAGRAASPLVLARIALYDWSAASACVPDGCVLPGV
jgi:hypothetical protein